MTYTQLLKYFGGNVSKAARELGYERQTIYYWQKNGISPRTQELLTSKLKAMRINK